MNDSMNHWESSGDQSRGPDLPCEEAPPRFGAVDIVEAFTAMRHDWREQTKESRALAEQIQAAVISLQSLQSQLPPQAASGSADDSTAARQLVLLIVEMDHQLSRAVAAIEQLERSQRLREEAEVKAVQRYFAGMSRLARWFARTLLAFVAEQRQFHGLATENPAVEGLNLVLARLRRAMNEHDIERIDTQEAVFDADIMHAIGTVERADCPSGRVVEQLSPAYRWQGRIVRFADVRVAK